MYNGNDGGYGGMFRQPAQRETISGGYEGGVRIPVIQAFASIIFASLTILFTWILLFVIGPDVLWVAGFVTVFVIARRILLWIGTAQQNTQEQINGARAATIAVCIIVLTLSGAWATSRQFCVIHWPMILPTVSIWRTVFAITFIIPPIIVCAFMAFQFLVNAYNPAAFQPHQAKPAGTPWWSPTGHVLIETDPDYPEQVIIEKYIPRPIPMFSNHVEQLPEPDEARQWNPKLESFRSPPFPGNDKGITCMWKDLVEFVTIGLDIGIGNKAWYDRKKNARPKWTKGYIQALQHTLAQHDIAISGGEASAFRLTIKTKAEAASAISMLHKGLYPEMYPEQYPTTPPCVEAVQTENTSGLDRQTVDS